MANINEEARIPVYINDEQAKSALRNLQTEANKWKKAMRDAMVAHDDKGWREAKKSLNQTEKAMNDLKRESFNVDAVLQKISSASAKDLKQALKAVDKEMNDLNRDTKEYQALANKRTKLKDELYGINNQLRDQGGILQKLKGAAGGLLPAFGWASAAAGALTLLKKGFESTEGAADKLRNMLALVNGGVQGFWHTVMSGNWKELVSNIKETANATRDLAAAKNELEHIAAGKKLLDAELEFKKNEAIINASEAASAEDRKRYLEEAIDYQKHITQNKVDMLMKSSKLEEDYYKKLSGQDKEYWNQFISQVPTISKNYETLYGFLDGYKVRLEQLKYLQQAQVNGLTAAQEEERHQLQLTIYNLEDFKTLQDDLSKEGQWDKFIEGLEAIARAEATGKAALKEITNELKATNKEIGNGINLEVSLTEAIADEADARKAIMESIAEAEKLMFEVSEEEYRKAIDNIKEFKDILDSEAENNVTAAGPVDPNFATLDQQQAFYDARMALIDSQYQREKQAAQGNKSALLAAEARYNQEVYQMKSELIDAEYAIVEQKIAAGRDYIFALSGFIDQESKLGKALFLFDQALAIGEVWVNIAKANAKAVAVSPMTFGQPWVAVNTGQGIKQTALIAAQTVAKFAGGKKAGGFTDSASTDDKVVDYVHSNEFVASAPAVRNPTIKPVLDIIDIAQRTGQVANLNLPAVLAGGGRQSGGYASGSGASSSSSLTTNNYYQGDPELKSMLAELRELMKKGVKAKLVYRELEEYSDEVDNIRNNASF